jgi:predicted rRNA methylase YqxC with S4 and FtsJ domains
MELELMELENNDYERVFTKSEQYKEKIHQLDMGIHLLLQEFRKTYVITNMHPTNEEYQNQYQSIINSLAEILSKLFSVSNDVQVNIDNLNKKLLEFDILIRQEREKNKELKRKLGIVENKSNAASEMISDYKDIYDKRYLRNWSLLLSSIICILAIRKIFTPSKI